ncbi:MAG: VWA domain-containing protein [Dehalococcoidia bacterium]
MKRTVLLVTLLALVAASVASAADPVRLEVNALEEKPGLVSVVMTALDSSGKPVTDLTAGNFRASLNGIDIPVSSLDTPGNGAKLSTGIVLLVDVSGSMYGEPIVEARAALQELVKNLDTTDQVAVLAFSNGVTTLQDFTTNRTQINNGINKLTAFGDTALYDAITEATQKAASSQASRKLVILLSDGASTVNNGARDPSIEAVRASGVSIVSVGLGNQIDREYLQALADASGGRVLEASTPAALRQAYIDLAASIRSRYTLHITVPPTFDRTVAGQLTIRLSSRAGDATIERTLEPLAGAKVPDFTIKVGGLKANQVLNAPQALTVSIPEGISLSRVEYLLDGASVHVATAAPFGYSVDPKTLAEGSHVVKVVATDARGANAQAETVFKIPAPAASSPLSTLLPILMVLLVLGGIGGLVYKIIAKRLKDHDARDPDNVVRIRPFALKSTEEMARPQDWPERPPVPVAPVNHVRGRIVVMDEQAIREGDLTAITEYSIGNAPLTLGAGATCDIQIIDEDNIAMEEARLWVQKGRLVYHKLTTLSAMATEGVTSGWLLLADGEELHLGKYRLLFQAEIPASSELTEGSEAQEPNKHFMGWSV